MSEQALLDELAQAYGIASEYWDIWGRRHATSDETKRAILAEMGVRAVTEEDLQKELVDVRARPWRALCDPVLVAGSGAPGACWSLRLPVDEGEESLVRLRWEVRDEEGRLCHKAETGLSMEPAETYVLEGQRHLRVELPLPPGLEMGYYDLAAYAVTPKRFLDGALRLIVVPDQCFVPPSLLEGRRIWGLALQLYALRSGRNWGAGDFSDLTEVVEWVACDLKAWIIGLNPVHALKNSRPYHISPYSPDSRLYLNLLYLDVERVPEFQDSAAVGQVVEDGRFRATLQALRADPIVDYDGVTAAKRRLLELCFAHFEETHLRGGAGGPELEPVTQRGQAFLQYLHDEGEAIEYFALFQALAEAMEREHPEAAVWQEWPEAYRDPRSAAVRTFRASHDARIRLHQYVQWILSEQLGAVAKRARALGMSVGLFHDLALGSDRSGADGWVFQDVLALGVECGCPPDAFSPEGQNWGFPPVNPHRLRATGYRMFVDLLRHNLRFGGALRLDHVMALFRLFWIPRGLPASTGAYVRYPVEDLLGILALESVRHRAMIVGEDLGTVPDEVRERLGAARVLSYRVLYFERWDDGRAKAPDAYPAQALAVVTTHDLPTLAGFWAGRDIEARAGLGSYRDSAAERAAWEERYQDKLRIWTALKAENLLPPGLPDDLAAVPLMTPELCAAIHAYLARTPSWVVMASLEDIVGEMAQTNLPGTLDEYPNWSRKASLSVEGLRGDPRPREVAASLGT